LSSKTGQSVKLGDDEREKVRRFADLFRLSESEIIRIAIRRLKEEEVRGYADGIIDGRKAKLRKIGNVIPALNKTDDNEELEKI